MGCPLVESLTDWVARFVAARQAFYANPRQVHDGDLEEVVLKLTAYMPLLDVADNVVNLAEVVAGPEDIARPTMVANNQ